MHIETCFYWIIFPSVIKTIHINSRKLVLEKEELLSDQLQNHTPATSTEHHLVLRTWHLQSTVKDKKKYEGKVFPCTTALQTVTIFFLKYSILYEKDRVPSTDIKKW